MIKKTLGTMFAVTMIFLLILTVFTLFFGSYYFGVAGFFAIFGVTYEWPWSLFWYILLSFGLGALFEIPEKILSFMIGHKAATFMIECFFTWLAIHLADELMDSITIPLDVEIIACLFLFVIHLAFEDNKERNRTYED
ncbi:regulatory YrvL family protein [Bacillus licheniformis]|uniref:regulatory YrvL family protein n=1 Tax=Bacillus licheniformis TaxID=1402 RepID=UPI00227EB0E8|nr:regulatory YrvL family protein [Bacillus licheniformis]MCY8022171.1 regulatory YrvL family protein [Bacillus licheniformis]